MWGTLRGPPHSVGNAQGTPLIDDNVTHLCYYTMYNIGHTSVYVRDAGSPPHSVRHAQGTPLIDDNVTHLCYYTMYNIGHTSVYVRDAGSPPQ